MTTSCHFCGEPVDPSARDTYRRVTGWERKALAESRIVLREPVADFAHPACIALACIALLQSGLSPKQVSLL